MRNVMDAGGGASEISSSLPPAERHRNRPQRADSARSCRIHMSCSVASSFES